MSCCGGNCGCGDSCKCGSGCTGCGMYPPDGEKTITATIIDGVAPMKMSSESEMSFGAEGGHACECGSNCTCNPCNC